LLTRLEMHMVPSTIVLVKEFPRLASGKVDRKACEELLTDQRVVKESQMSAEPKQGYESKIIQIWKANLGTTILDANQTYFEAGGDSISAIRLVSAIRQEYPDSSFTVKDVFDYPTIEGVAKRLGIDESLVGEEQPHLMLSECKVQANVPLSRDQMRLREVWERVLQTKVSEPSANFFEVGGDSLLAIKLVNSIRQEYAVDFISVRNVINNPTLASMSDLLAKSASEENQSTIEVSTARDILRDEGRSDRAREDDGCLVHARRSHTSSAVVCLPGLGWMGGEFSEFIESSSSINVYIARNPKSSASLCDTVAELVRAVMGLDMSRVVLLGHSMGGVVAGMVAERATDEYGVDLKVCMLDTHEPMLWSIEDEERHSAMMVASPIVGDASSWGEGQIKALKDRFVRNVEMMRKWVRRGELATSLTDFVMVEAAESSHSARRFRGSSAEQTFVIPAADHFTMLRWPHVQLVVEVVRCMIDEEE